MIAPVMIVCGERYVKTGIISINSFLKWHNDKLFIIVDNNSFEKINFLFGSKNVCIVNIEEFLQKIIDQIGFPKYELKDMDKDGDHGHDRTYSALKPLIMDAVVSKYGSEFKYILSLDSDTFFSGNIIETVQRFMYSYDYQYDLYLVARKDERMQLLHDLSPGSGFTLWKRSSQFIQKFVSKLSVNCTKSYKGGSQFYIHSLAVSGGLKYKELEDPLLHFISPDIANPRITDEEILELKPAYIHLHGADSYKRLLKFERIFLGL